MNFFFFGPPILILLGLSYWFFLLEDWSTMRDPLLLIYFTWLLTYFFADSSLLFLIANLEFEKGCDNFFYYTLIVSFVPLIKCAGEVFMYTIALGKFCNFQHYRAAFLYERQVEMPSLILSIICYLGGTLFLSLPWVVDLSECNSVLEIRRYLSLTLVSLGIATFFHRYRDLATCSVEDLKTNWVLQWLRIFSVFLVATILSTLENGERGNIVRFFKFHLVSVNFSVSKMDCSYIIEATEMDYVHPLLIEAPNRFAMYLKRKFEAES